MFDPIPSRVSFPALEADTLAFWREHDVFRRSVDERPADRIFNFYEGPPTANGNPGIHHVLARVFKDLIPRYRTMRGDRVPRKGGWDTHGLPVELEVERQLGLHSKLEIEAYGVEAFNQQCRDSVFRYVSEWERMTERIGYWVDTEHPYVTYSREYVETCWWIFKRLFDNGLMFRDYRVTPHCPRCGTSLSSHEIALGYKEDTPDPSVTVLFRADAAASAEAGVSPLLRLADGVPTFVVAWTTTPWTLPGNVALALNADAEYAIVEYGSEHPSVGRVRLILAASRVGAVIPGMAPREADTGRGISLADAQIWQDDSRVIATVRGSDVVGLRYEPLYESREWDEVEALAFVDGRTQRIEGDVSAPARRVVAADFVQTDDGTGIVHIAPAFGEDDYALGRAEGLMFLQPVGLDGKFVGGPWAGEFVKDADRGIRRDLRQRGVLLRDEQIRHTYPFCWRCDTPVLYYAKPSWYIRTTAVKDALIEGNQRIHWVPDHIRDGRFGGWLEGNIDWAVSRERYWGTPLPLWTCEGCATVECIGSYAELRERSGAAEEIADPHRPFIDAVTLPCAACGGTMRRTPEVADAWFDSGAMPYAQAHYPFEDASAFGSRFPADFICEAVDQTRGWFYTLHALATLLNRTDDVPDSIAYRNVICLGHILDGEGLKMSKSRGNVVDPWTVLDTQGADALRWYLYTASPPGNSRRFSTELVGEVSRRFLSTLWNTYSFFVTYANIANFDPSSAPPAQIAEQRSELDRWVRSELHRTVQRVTEGLDAYEPADAARPIGEFVEQLSNWYVRRSRRRFWKSDDSADTQAALHTLYECLTTVTRLLAPFTPFVAEAMYRNLVAGRVPGAADSVHLDAWPEVDVAAIDEQLSTDIALVQRMVSLGRAARQQASVRVRQPLATAVLVPRVVSERTALERLADQVADELNVKSVEVTAGDDRLRYSLRPNLPVLGPRFGREIGPVRAAIAAADAAVVAARMRDGEPLGIGDFDLAAGDILVSVEATEGWAASEESGYVVLLDTRITPELESEGLMREIVRRLQDLRREAGLEVTDRIRVTWRGDAVIGKVMADHGPTISEEVLALSLDAGDGPDAPLPDGAVVEADIEGHAVTLALRKA
ncbi:MAG: isoleucine--tRNA ligase [Chloroflexi bacterium]|nr:MAG: isoleucine--tRNA ligase [Chloroflexota bacterium]